MAAVIKAAQGVADDVGSYAAASIAMFAPEKPQEPPTGERPRSPSTVQFSEKYLEETRFTRKMMDDAAAPQVVVHDNDHEWVVKTWREAKARILGEVDNSIDVSKLLHPWEFGEDAKEEEEEEPEPELEKMTTVKCPNCRRTETVPASHKPTKHTCRKCATVYVA